MSARLNALETKLSSVQKELDDMVTKADAEDRSLTQDETIVWDQKTTELKQLKKDADTERQMELVRQARALDKAIVNSTTPEQKIVKDFSWSRALQCLVRNKIDGAEGEMTEEARKELRGTSMEIEGVGFPGWAINFKGTNVINAHKRDLTSGGTGTGLEYIETMEKMHQFGLDIAPKALQLGVEVWAGLTGNVYVNETGVAASVWETETATNDETTPATSRPFTLSPKRLGAYTDVSKTLLTQTSGIAGERVRRQLQNAQNVKLDYTIFQGSGVSPIPTGIFNTSGINTETSGGVPDRQLFWNIFANVAGDNAWFDDGKSGIAMTAAIYAFLANAPIDAGSGRFVLENGQINGLPVIWSNNIPTNYILFGDYSKFVVGQWGGVDLVLNPYTRAKDNILEVVINQFFDMGCLYPKAFCAVTDATLS